MSIESRIALLKEFAAAYKKQDLTYLCNAWYRSMNQNISFENLYPDLKAYCIKTFGVIYYTDVYGNPQPSAVWFPEFNSISGNFDWKQMKEIRIEFLEMILKNPLNFLDYNI